jgi:hypothetical protein
MKKKLIIVSAFLVAFGIQFGLYSVVFGAGEGLKNPLGENATLQTFISKLLDIVVRVGSIAAVLYLVYVGYLFVSAQGDTKKIEEARHAFLYTVIGITILLGAKIISLMICNTVQATMPDPSKFTCPIF